MGVSRLFVRSCWPQSNELQYRYMYELMPPWNHTYGKRLGNSTNQAPVQLLFGLERVDYNTGSLLLANYSQSCLGGRQERMRYLSTIYPFYP